MSTPEAGIRVRRLHLDLLEWLPGVWCVARDADLRIFWLNTLQERMSRFPREQIIGQPIRGGMPAPGAEEREQILREVMDTGLPRHVYLLASTGCRVQASILPLDEPDFGHRGIVVAMRYDSISRTPGSHLMRTPRVFFDSKFSQLSRRELELLHLLAQGRSNADIAKAINRSEKTVVDHTRRIHRKLGTESRNALLHEAALTGIAAFTAEEWLELIDGEIEMRRAFREDRKQGVTGP